MVLTADNMVPTSETYDVIMVLGGGIGLDGSLGNHAKKQVDTAAAVYTAGLARRIITCGSYGYKARERPQTTEAEAYKRYAVELGIRQDDIYLEPDSMDTLGNILFAKMNVLKPHGWSKLVVIPTVGHSTERIDYILHKVLGPGYEWKIIRSEENLTEDNVRREARSLALTKEINDPMSDGDDEAVYAALLTTYPAYGGTKFTVDELRRHVG